MHVVKFAYLFLDVSCVFGLQIVTAECCMYKTEYPLWGIIFNDWFNGISGFYVPVSLITNILCARERRQGMNASSGGVWTI